MSLLVVVLEQVWPSAMHVQKEDPRLSLSLKNHTN